MLQLFVTGLLLGLGASVPIGPVNLEIIRRNIHLGTAYGFCFSLGACCVDLTYLVLLSLGALSLAHYPRVLEFVGLIGSLILLWFAIKIFRSNLTDLPEHKAAPSQLRNWVEGYIMTFFNPYTILFWASLSSQVSLTTLGNHWGLALTSLGVILGVVSWALTLNLILHFTRHRLSRRAIHWLNYGGGLILLGFSMAGILRFFHFG